MKASKFSDAQKAFILRQGADGMPVADVCRKAGISQATYFNWRKKYAGMLPPEMKKLKQLEDENARLKKIVADLTLDREMLQDVIRRKLPWRNVMSYMRAQIGRWTKPISTSASGQERPNWFGAMPQKPTFSSIKNSFSHLSFNRRRGLSEHGCRNLV